MRCLTCQYDLKNLTEHRCPECGRAFDPNDPYTFDSAAFRRRRLERRVLELAGYAAFSFLLNFVLMVYVEATSPRSEMTNVLGFTLLLWPVSFVATLLAFKV